MNPHTFILSVAYQHFISCLKSCSNNQMATVIYWHTCILNVLTIRCHESFCTCKSTYFFWLLQPRVLTASFPPYLSRDLEIVGTLKTLQAIEIALKNKWHSHITRPTFCTYATTARLTFQL